MPAHIALFRGINVGGSKKLPMADLKEILAGLGAEHVRTYIQSGNVVFRADEIDRPALARRIGEAVSSAYGFKPHVLVISPERLESAIAGNPFPEAEDQPKSLHVFFLAARPGDPDMEKIDALNSPNERWALEAEHFYLHAPDGIARSKLAGGGAEKALGVAATARNWNTVCRIRDMARVLDDG